jgi:hypothetical protein
VVFGVAKVRGGLVSGSFARVVRARNDSDFFGFKNLGPVLEFLVLTYTFCAYNLHLTYTSLTLHLHVIV